MSDLGTFLQERYDAGDAVVNLERQVGGIVWNRPLFLDSTAFGPKFEFNAGSNEITLGPDLPRTGNAFTPDVGSTDPVRVACFPNTKRDAWDSSLGNVWMAGGKATAQGAAMRFVLKGGRFSAGGRNVGLVFGNRSGSVLDGVVLHGARFALSWIDYTEPNVVMNGHFQTAGGAAQVQDAFYVYGLSNGDGVRVASLKCDGAVGGVSLRECGGAELSANITAKTRLTRCRGIVVTAAHQEAGIYASYSPNYEIVDSEVLFLGGVFYPPREAGRATIEVKDTPGSVKHSKVKMVNPGYRLLPDHASTAQPFIQVSRNAHTVFRVEDLSSLAATGPGVWAPTSDPAMYGITSRSREGLALPV